jgi:hypothetical protein
MMSVLSKKAENILTWRVKPKSRGPLSGMFGKS